jgi:hypothetical protein
MRYSNVAEGCTGLSRVKNGNIGGKVENAIDKN